MGVLKTKVQIGGTTIKDDSGSDPKLIISWEYERTIEKGISEMVISCPKTITDTISLQVGTLVEVWSGFTTSTDKKIFSGYISNYKPDGGLIEIICKDKMWNLVRRRVNQVYENTGAQAGQISAIAKDLIETHGGLTSDEVSTGTGTYDIISTFKCIHATIYERLMVLAKAVNYQVFYDAVNDTVHFEPRGYTQSGVTLTVGSEIINVPKWKYDTNQMINDLRVDGASIETELRYPTSGTGRIGTTANFDETGITLPFTPESVKLTIDAVDPPTTLREGGSKDGSASNYYYVDKENKKVIPATGTTFTTDDYAFIEYTWLSPAPIHMINSDSIDNYGKFEVQMNLNDVTSVADAEARATEILARFSQPFTEGELLVKSVSTIDLDVGETLSIIDNVSSPRINQEMVITKQTIKYPGSNQELIVGDESIKLQDWQVNVDDRIKRLEEGLIRNQDLITELVGIQNINSGQNAKKLRNRYFQVISETYDTTNSVMIWDNADHGTWGTEKWGDGTDTFETAVTTFMKQKDNEYTEDFIDDDFEGLGTATWSTTGSVSFTSGQFAQSLPIDYANGTIIKAKLTSTEVSGSFDYEMTADGNNWESVTSGVTHFFTNSGTDLRWRATENNVSTGEISKIEIIDYH